MSVERQAEEFVKSALASEDHEQRLKLVETLRHSMVGLRLAVAHIKSSPARGIEPDKKFKIADYLESYERARGDLLNLGIGEQDSRTRLTAAAVQLSSQAFAARGEKNGPEAKRIVDLLAYVAADKPICVKLFRGLKLNESSLEGALKLLAKYEILSQAPRGAEGSGKLRVEVQIQNAIRARLRQSASERSTLEQLVSSLLSIELDPDTVHHAITVWEHARQHADLVRSHHQLVINIWMLLQGKLGDFCGALAFAEEQLPILKRHLSPRDIAIPTLQNNLALAMLNQGRHSEALQLLKESSSGLFENDPRHVELYLVNQFNVALVLAAADREREALKVFQKTYETRRKLLGEKHRYTLTTRAHVLLLEHKFGKQSKRKSIKLLEEVLHDLSDISDGQHQEDVLSIKHNLGHTLINEGHFESAIKTLKEVFDSRERTLGLEHPHTMDTHREIGFALARSGKLAEGVRIFAQVLRGQEKALGSQHPKTLDTLMNLRLMSMMSQQEGH